MTETQPTTYEPAKSESVVPTEQHRAQTPIDHILERLSPLELPAKKEFENYLRHKSRLNHKRSTLESSFTSTMLFLDFYGKSGKHDLKYLERADLEAFIEHEQDRGLKISTVKTRMAFVVAFLHFLIEQDLLPRERSTSSKERRTAWGEWFTSRMMHCLPSSAGSNDGIPKSSFSFTARVTGLSATALL
ncbi:MAG: site-specific integrase [Syntrophorhabdales bacterium]